MDAYRALHAAGTPGRAAARLTGIGRSSMDRDRARPTRLPTPARRPVNALSADERARVLAMLDSDQFVDAAPAQVYAALLDQGVYVGSIATMYRILREHAQVRERRRQARHPARTRPELVATAPGQVYSWDITKLKGPVKGVYFDAYVMIDVYSRYIVGISPPPTPPASRSDAPCTASPFSATPRSAPTALPPGTSRANHCCHTRIERRPAGAVSAPRRSRPVAADASTCDADSTA